MNYEKIARILYSMSLDMDYSDSIDCAENEIDEIVKELCFLRENKCNCLVQAIEMIASGNEDMEYFYKTLKSPE